MAIKSNFLSTLCLIFSTIPLQAAEDKFDFFKNLPNEIQSRILFYVDDQEVEKSLCDNITVPYRELKNPSNAEVQRLALLPNGELASGSYHDNIVRIWDLMSGKIIKTLEGHTRGISDLSSSPEGKLASSSYDKTIRIWNVKSGKTIKVLKKPIGTTSSLAFTTNNQLATSFHYKETIIIWDLKSGKEIKTLNEGDHGVNTLFSLPYNQLAAGSNDGTIHIWDLNTYSPIQTFMGNEHYVNTVISLPGNKLACGGAGDEPITILDLKDGKTIWKLKSFKNCDTLALLPEGELASGEYSDKTVTIWDLKSGRIAKKLTSPTAGINNILSLPNNQIAFGLNDSTIQIWDLSKFQKIRNRCKKGFFPMLREYEFKDKTNSSYKKSLSPIKLFLALKSTQKEN